MTQVCIGYPTVLWVLNEYDACTTYDSGGSLHSQQHDVQLHPRHAQAVTTLVFSPKNLNNVPHYWCSSQRMMIHIWICCPTVLWVLYDVWTTSDRGGSHHIPQTTISNRIKLLLWSTMTSRDICAIEVVCSAHDLICLELESLFRGEETFSLTLTLEKIAPCLFSYYCVSSVDGKFICKGMSCFQKWRGDSTMTFQKHTFKCGDVSMGAPRFHQDLAYKQWW